MGDQRFWRLCLNGDIERVQAAIDNNGADVNERTGGGVFVTGLMLRQHFPVIICSYFGEFDKSETSRLVYIFSSANVVSVRDDRKQRYFQFCQKLKKGNNVRLIL